MAVSSVSNKKLGKEPVMSRMRARSLVSTTSAITQQLCLQVHFFGEQGSEVFILSLWLPRYEEKQQLTFNSVTIWSFHCEMNIDATSNQMQSGLFS